MADRKISELNNGGTIATADLVPVSRAGANFYVSNWGTMSTQDATAVAITGGTITNATVTTPSMQVVLDTNLNTALYLSSTAAAVSYVTLTNAAAGISCVVTVNGAGADIPLTVSAKGSSSLNLAPGASGTEVRVFNGALTRYAALLTSSLTASRQFTFPDQTGTFAMVSDLGSYQPLDTTLTSLAAYNTNGILTQTSADVFAGRTITGTANEITLTNGSGVAGNPTVSLPSALTFTGKNITGGTFILPSIGVADNGLLVKGASDNTKVLALSCSSITTGTTRTLTVPNQDGTIAVVSDLTSGYQPLDATLTSLAAYSTNGILTQTAADTFAGRTITGTAAEITVTNGNGVSGNPTLSLPASMTLTGKTLNSGTLTNTAIQGATITTPDITVADDVFNIVDNADATKQIAFEASGITTGTIRTLTCPNASGTIALTADLSSYQPLDAGLTALAAYNTNGVLVQSANDTFVGRTLTGTAAEITVTNGTGVSGNPTFSLPSALTFTGKTITGGTYTSPTINTPTLSVKDASISITGTADTSKVATFDCSTITTSTTRTLTVPNASGTLALTSDLTSGYQPLDATLTSLAAYSTNGILTQTAADTFAGRTITGTANELTVTDGNGVAGNPTLSIPAAVTFTGKTVTGGTYSTPTINTPVLTVNDSDLLVQDNLDTTKKMALQCSSISTGTTRTLTVPNQDGTIAVISDLTSGYQPLDAGLTALAAYNTNGVLCQTANNTFAGRTITGTAAEITVTNGDGVAGAPTLSLPTALTFTGKTVTGGTFTTPTIAVNDNGLEVRSAGDTTKKLNLSCASITTGTTRTLTVPNQNGTIAVVTDIPVLSTQADMETGTSTTTFVTPGRAQFHPSAAKAWVNYIRSTTTINASYNITSVTDNGTGDITVNIATDFSSANWAAGAVVAAGAFRHIQFSNTVAAGSAQVLCYNSTFALADPSYFEVVFYGDQ